MKRLIAAAVFAALPMAATADRATLDNAARNLSYIAEARENNCDIPEYEGTRAVAAALAIAMAPAAAAEGRAKYYEHAVESITAACTTAQILWMMIEANGDDA